jgi:DNA-binding transcriptional LysR family regulator
MIRPLERRGPVNLRNVDLNLLVAFDALMRERQVTRAARLLGVGQPAMSAALSRLRHLFYDELLVKQGGEMTPTARALALEPEVRRFLNGVAHLIHDTDRFDAATSARSFGLRMSDLLSFLLLPDLMRRLAATAPGVSLNIRHLDPDATVDALERDDVDLAVSTGLDVPKSIACERLFEDRVVCVTRQGHPDAARLDRAEAFVDLPQIRVSQSPLDDRFVDRQLAARGIDRRVVLTVPHWLAVPRIVAGTDLVAVMPESIASRMADTFDLQTGPPPLEDCAFVWCLYWHRRHGSDRGHEWLRRLTGEASAAAGLT